MNNITMVYEGIIYSKKNSKRVFRNQKTGRPIVLSSRKARENEKNMQIVFSREAGKVGWATQEGKKYSVKITIYNKDRIKRDLDNQLTAILDALVLARVIPDDSSKNVVKISAELGGVDSDNPRAVVVVSEVKKKAEK